MNWKLKAVAVLLIKIYPFDSMSLYYYLQRKSGKLNKTTMDRRLHVLKSIFSISQKYNIPKDMNIFEIGTGRYPLFPIMYFTMGAKWIISYDLNRLLKYELTETMIKSYLDNVHELSQDIRFNDSRINSLKEISSFQAFLETLKMSYVAPTDARKTNLEKESLDFVYSNAVFEHVYVSDIKLIHSEANRILKPGGYILHNIDLSDHFSHSDRRLSRVNFLKFSDKFWNFLTKNTFFYQNRLRLSEHAKMIEESGFKIIEKLTTCEEGELNSIDKINIKFESYSKEDLAVTNVIFLAQKI